MCFVTFGVFEVCNAYCARLSRDTDVLSRGAEDRRRGGPAGVAWASESCSGSIQNTVFSFERFFY